jgi:hypothetical protein
MHLQLFHKIEMEKNTIKFILWSQYYLDTKNKEVLNNKNKKSRDWFPWWMEMQKLKTELPRSSNSILRDISEGMSVKLQQRHLHTHVYCSIAHNSQIMERAKMPHYWLMD